jgi:hypothetical protein
LDLSQNQKAPLKAGLLYFIYGSIAALVWAAAPLIARLAIGRAHAIFRIGGFHGGLLI